MDEIDDRPTQIIIAPIAGARLTRWHHIAQRCQHLLIPQHHQCAVCLRGHVDHIRFAPSLLLSEQRISLPVS